MSNPIQDIANNINQAEGYRNISLGGKTYSIKLLPASTGFTVATLLLKTFLPAIGSWVDSQEREGLVLPEEENVYAEIAMLLCTQMDKIDLLSIVQTLLSEAAVNNAKFNFDIEFRGNYGNLIALIEFALKENFKDFFLEYLQSKGISLSTLSHLSPTKKAQDQIQPE